VRLSGARLLKRVVALDLEHCPNCGGVLRITAAGKVPVCSAYEGATSGCLSNASFRALIHEI